MLRSLYWHLDREILLAHLRRTHFAPADRDQALGEFLRFRHVFRSIYGFVLEADRMRPLEDALPGVLGRFVTQIRTFNAWMLGEESS